MKRCPFNNPDFITRYYDGCLSAEEKEKFQEHLLTCKQCMDTLFNLENDLFLMNSLKLERPSERKFKKALFRLISNGIELVKNIEGPFSFEPLMPVRVRGEFASKGYRLQKGSAAIEIGSRGRKLFDMGVSGVEGKQISLYSKDRLVEAHSCEQDKRITLYNLRRGSYRLSVDDEDILEFTVE
jgi:hypothetical protein